tara:strand:- start:43 stop:609 length:567 start_codon:yes stop_codon:yes gene_type:complete
MGTLFVDNIKQQSSQGSGTITIGASGETVALASGVKQSNLNYPAFNVELSSTQTGVSDNVATKVNFNTELLDTDNAYDNSTNYRFTVPSGADGKYYIEGNVQVANSTANNMQNVHIYIYKNGSSVRNASYGLANATGYFNNMSIVTTSILNLVATDYIEIFAKSNTASGDVKFESNPNSYFLGYRIGS